jgi:putative hemolysin
LRTFVKQTEQIKMTEGNKSANTVEIGKNFIEVEKVIGSKNPKLLKLLPRFVIRYLKRIIHQDEMNATIYKHRDKFGLDFVDATLKDFNITVEASGIENIPVTGKCIIVANHPLGGMDGMAFFQAVGRVRRDLIFPVNDILLTLPGLKVLYVPINKHGLNTNNIDIIEQTFASEKAILYFPAGLCSRKKRGKIVDLEWKKTFISKAKKYQREVIPAFIEGRNSNFFYNLANLRKFLRMKVNFEMLYLVDELYKQRNRTLKIRFGNPISYKTFDNTLKDVQWAEKVKEQVYSLNAKK